MTLIELIMTMIIVGILAGTSSYLLVAFADQSVYLPLSFEMAQAADEAMDLILEGDATAGGLRYARSIKSTRAQFLRYTDQDGRDVRIRFRKKKGYFQRSVDGAAWQNFPSFYNPDLRLVPIVGTTRVFWYYNQNFKKTKRPNRVRFVRVEYRVENQNTNAFTPSILPVLSGMSVAPFP